MIRNLDAPWHTFRLPDVGRIVSQNWQALVLGVDPSLEPGAAFQQLYDNFRGLGFRPITAPLPEYGVHACLLQKDDERISLSIEVGPRDAPQLLMARSYPPDVAEEWLELGFPPADWDALGGDDHILTMSGSASPADAMAVAVAVANKAGFEVTEAPAVSEVGGAGTLTGTKGTLHIGVVRTGDVTLLTTTREAS
jgi:hypothetical protein